MFELGEHVDEVRLLVRQAGAYVRSAAPRDGSMDHDTKAGPLDPVTAADVKAEAMIRDGIARLFPHDGFWGEECGRPEDPGRGRVWICDPIDGTRSFIRFGHNYCVSLGMLLEGRIVLAMIFDPECNDFYEASAGQGAFLNGKRLRIAAIPGLDHALIGIGYSERVAADSHATAIGHILRGGAMCHQHGSGALALAQVAAGRLDAYLELHQNAWDALPGLLIAEEAGAKCLAWLPDDLTRGAISLAANPGIAASLARIATGPKTPKWGVVDMSQ